MHDVASLAERLSTRIIRWSDTVMLRRSGQSPSAKSTSANCCPVSRNSKNRASHTHDYAGNEHASRSAVPIPGSAITAEQFLIGAIAATTDGDTC